VMELAAFKQLISPPKEKTLEAAVYKWRRGRGEQSSQ
jgi:hypothetical protein